MKIFVDFDGVLHSYSKGWQGGKIYDIPVKGAKEAMQSLKDEGHTVIIYTTRAYDRLINGKLEKNQVQEVSDYLHKYGIPFDFIYTGVGKPVGFMYIDDRAFRFTGDWKKSMPEILNILSKG